jgi:hypothetical protein
MGEETRAEPSSLKGPLAEVFVEALLGGEVGPLLRRLGNRAKVTDPAEGRAAGLAQLEPALTHIRERILALHATYERSRVIRGVDHDVAEGVLVFIRDGRTERLPIATLVQRGRAREVELRLYYTPSAMGLAGGRSATLDPPPDFFVPKLAQDFTAALTQGRIDSVLALFEASGKVIDSVGGTHERSSGGLTIFLQKLAAHGFGFENCASADDGRACVLEGNVSRVAGADVPLHPALLVLQRGDSGLVSEMRVYRDGP